MPLRTTAITAAVAVMATFGIAGCSGKTASSIVRHSIPDVLHSSDSTEMDAGFIAAGFGAIDAKVGTPAYGVIRVSINPSMVAMQVVDPNKPGNVDEYDYRRGKGAVDAPRPVDLTGSEPGALEQNTFPRADLDPAVIARVIQEAPGQSGIEQAAASGATISYPLVAAADAPPRIQVDVSGPRGHANPRYSLQGEQLEQ